MEKEQELIFNNKLEELNGSLKNKQKMLKELATKLKNFKKSIKDISEKHNVSLKSEVTFKLEK